MINIEKILKRAWHILWNYKILWIFGVLLAITAGGTHAGSNGSSGIGYQFNGRSNPNSFVPGTWLREFNAWAGQNLVPLFSSHERAINTAIWLGAGILVLILAIGAIAAFIRYPSETAVMRMVNEYEQTGIRVGFKQGWKFGWSRAAFRMWVIDLIISLPAILFVLLLIGLGVLFYFAAISGWTSIATAGVLIASGCAFLFLFAFIILMVFLGLLRHFFVRATVLENTGIRMSFRLGWQMFKRNWKSVVLMWLVNIGIGIGYAVAGIFLIIVLIPVFFITGVAGLIAAIIPGLIAFGLSSLFASGPLTWIIAILVGLPFFFLVLGSPLLLTGGWMQIFLSSVWTLTYREMKALEVAIPVENQAKTG